MIDSHPDDEQLSAHVDSRAAATIHAHIDACERCSRRVAELRAVSAAVATPPPPPGSDVTARAVAAAVAAAPDARQRTQAPGGRSWRKPVAILAAAAVVITLLAAAPLLNRKRSSTAALAQNDARSGASASPVQGADLGDQTSAQRLGDLVRSRMGPVGQGESAATAPSAASGAGAVDAGVTDCLEAARQVAGEAATPLYSATVRWRGTPAVVLVFPAQAAAGGSLSRQLLVLGRRGCAVLVAQRF